MTPYSCRKIGPVYLIRPYFLQFSLSEFVGKYECIKIDNYDEFLKELDVNYLIRKAAFASNQVFEVSMDGTSIIFKTSTILKVNRDSLV